MLLWFSFLSPVCGGGDGQISEELSPTTGTRCGEGEGSTATPPHSLGHPGRSPKGVICSRHSCVLWCYLTFTPLSPGQTMDVQGRGPTVQKWGVGLMPHSGDVALQLASGILPLAPGGGCGLRTRTGCCASCSGGSAPEPEGSARPIIKGAHVQVEGNLGSRVHTLQSPGLSEPT